VDLLRHAGFSGTGGGAFSAGSDIAWLVGFTAMALAAAAFRFENAGANESLVHRLAQ